MINWKLRLKNKVTLTGITSTVIVASYQVCSFFDIVPPISQDTIIQWVGLGLTMLAGVGVITDPTTKGIGDSNQALDYDMPRDDKQEVQ